MIIHCADEDISLLKGVGVNRYDLLERTLATSIRITHAYMLLPAIPLLRIYCADILPHMQDGMYTRTLNAGSFVMTEN